MTIRTRVRQAVILAGGLGTRLGNLVSDTPKPLLTVADRPFLDYTIEWLTRAGVEEIIISTGYLAGAFSPFINSRIWTGPEGKSVRVTEFQEQAPAGTAGALLLMREQLAERFFLVNGDSFFMCDPVRTAIAAEALPPDHMVLTVRGVADTSKYGRVEITPNGEIKRFIEKGKSGAGLINAGISVLSRDVVNLIENIPCSIEQEVYPVLATQGRLHAVEQEGYFIDIGLPETYAAAQEALPAALMRPAVFFDRDGVLNVDADGYTHEPEKLQLISGAAEAVSAAREANYQTIVVTNQAGIAHGLYDEAAVQNFHISLNNHLRLRGGWIDAFYYCPYHPDGKVAEYRRVHPDRKPQPGMLQRAALDLQVDMQKSFLVGDKKSDIEAAERAGTKGYLYTGGDLKVFVSPLLQARSS